MSEEERTIERLIYEALCVSMHYHDKSDEDLAVPIDFVVLYIRGKKKMLFKESDKIIKIIFDISSKSGMFKMSNGNKLISLTKSVYFKFRDNFEYINDIILNNRLHTAKYTDLNDPYEGSKTIIIDYSNSSPERVVGFKIAQIHKAKICALSKTLNNILLWAHYANSCKGVAIGFEIKNIKGIEVKEIAYKNNDTIEKNDNPLFLKDSVWEYEKEVRILSKRAYIPIKVKIVILGQRMKPHQKNIMRKLISKIDKNIIIVDNYECKMLPFDNVFT
jgi:hypothetical protein